MGLRYPLAFLLAVLLVAPLSGAHSLETKEIIKSDGNYNVKFSSDPEFPVIRKKTHMDFEVWDNSGRIVEEANINAFLELNGRRRALILEKNHNHRETEHVFEKPGAYKIIPVINGNELAIIFELEVDSFGASGLARTTVIILLLFALLWLVYRDCVLAVKKTQSKRKNKKFRNNNEKNYGG